ncbi:MAG TPA: hypothetical protein PKV36_25850, partial [Leptospiraceae bacterium]|nr:hypothetical protein [Leptospiraceae bacterium]
MNQIKLKIYIFIQILFLLPVSAQETTQTNKVIIGKIQPYESETNQNLEKEIQSTLASKLQESKFLISNSTESTLPSRLKEAKMANARYLLEGFYNKKSNDSNLNLYIQIYDPQTERMIDAYSITDEVFQSEGLQLDKEELKENDKSIIEKLSKKTVIILRSNPNKKENSSNI